MNSVTLENVGAIGHRIEIPIPETGGVTILTGRNGCGKSTALDAISTLVSGKGKLPPLRDGAREGKVEGFNSNITLKVSGSRRGGGKAELIVDSIEGRFSIADLVNPNVKDPKAADRDRLKALITLIGIEATPDLFATLFMTKEEFEKCVSKSSTDTTDPILMAERVKRDIEEKARIEEERARRAFAEHDAMVVGTDFDPADIIVDMDAFYRAFDEASQRLGKLQAERDAYERVARTVDQAKRSIETVDVAAKERQLAEESGLIFERKKEIEERVRRIDEYNARIEELEQRIKDEESQKSSLRQANDASNRIVVSINAELAALDGYQKIVEQSKTVNLVHATEIESARAEVDALRSKMDVSAVAKENKRKRDSATEMLKRAESIRDKAADLRDAARRCDVILTELIGADSPLRIHDNRMVVDTERGETFYADLSDGERWRIAFETIAPHIRRDPEKTALIMIPQVGWESLDPTNKQLVDDLSIQHRIGTITAEATDGELSVKRMQ